MGEPFEGSEGGESPDREDGSLEALRNRLRTKYSEAEPRDQGVSPMAEWEDGRLGVRESSDEKERENELEILRMEIIEKYPSAEERSPKSGPNQKFEKDRDNLSIDETQKSDSSKQRLQDPAVDSGDRDREHEEERSRVESKLEPDPLGRHEIDGGSTSIAREHQPGTDNVAQRVDSSTSAGRELVSGAQELRAEPAGHSPVPEERSDLKVPDAKEVRERHVIESTLQGEGKGGLLSRFGRTSSKMRLERRWRKGRSTRLVFG